jgi:hypothetical protein
MATTELGTATFQGLQTKATYAVDIFISDVLAAPVTFDSGGGATATSLPFWKAPENVVLVDLSIATGNTVTTALVPTSNGGLIAGNRLRTANFLNTLAFRPAIKIGFKAGNNIGFLQA